MVPPGGKRYARWSPLTLFEFDALTPLRTGRFADAATAIAWLVGGTAVACGYWWEAAVRGFVVTNVLGVAAGLVVAGVLLGFVASSVQRAVASGFAFGITVVTVGALLWVVTGRSLLVFYTGEPAVKVAGSAAIALGIPVVTGALVRVLT